MDKQLLIVIMAAGEGQRMNLNQPKELCEIDGKPILARIINEVSQLNPRKIMVVVSKCESIIKETIKPFVNMEQLEFINQGHPLGTGHTIITSRHKLKKFNHANVLVIPGDIPFLKLDLLKDIITNTRYAKMVIGKCNDKHDYDYVKLIKNEFKEIIHHFDADQNIISKIKYIDTGIYVFDVVLLCKYILDIDYDNKPKEYILNDILKIINTNENVPIDIYKLKDFELIQVMGVKTQVDLTEMINYMEALKDCF